MPLSSLSRSIGGRTAVVTGAGSGMGRATVRLFADEGARVAVLDRQADRVDEAVAELVGAGATALGVAVDVAEPRSLADAVRAVRRDLGPVDIVVNNAGVSLPAPIHSDAYEAAWATTIAVNLTAHARLVRLCVDDLSRERAGRVVNIASTEGLGASPFISPYTASKHGVIGLTRALAVELGSQGVTVNAVCPGPIHTGMTASIPDDAKSRFARRRVPLRRYGDPEEVAHVVLSLALPAASFVNGAVVTVDGGMTAQNT